jgi:hypothetical protein
VTVSPDRAIAAIKTWFAQLPDQNEMRTLMLELPDGRNAPNADGFVVPTRVVAEDDEVVIDLDSLMQYRFRGLNDVRPVSETQLRLEGFDVLDVIWKRHGERLRRYRDGDARFLSSHNIRTYPTSPQPGRE